MTKKLLTETQPLENLNEQQPARQPRQMLTEDMPAGHLRHDEFIVEDENDPYVRDNQGNILGRKPGK
jgi:hypothetical protein